jgi:hypothetical protein
MRLPSPVDMPGTRRARRCGGWTVAEVLIASAIGAIFLVGVVLTSISAIRNFAGMYNYTDMSMDSRLAMDKIARNIRSARGVCLQSANILTLTNPLSTGTITYTFTPSTRTLICDQTGQSTILMLTNCDSWKVSIYQRSPTTNYDNTTNSSPGTTTTKLLSMKWTCSRTIMGRKFNTETVQEARIVLRNEAN